MLAVVDPEDLKCHVYKAVYRILLNPNPRLDWYLMIGLKLYGGPSVTTGSEV